ncbi:MAG: hypothetical protein M1274_03100 [Actinobacteria bacterium]|nr:hypothetical protein [Actinomycetota bacterium]
MDFRKTAGCFGIGFVVLEVAGFVLWGAPPATGAAASEITRYFAEAGNMPKIGSVLNAFAYTLAVPFMVGFILPFLRKDREHGEGYGWLVFGGFLVTGATALVGLSGSFAQVLRGGAELNGATTRAVSDLSNMAYGLAIFVMVVWAGGAAVAVFRRRVMPKWFGYLSVLAALGGISGIVSVVSAGLGMAIDVGFVLLVLWVLTASAVMLRKPMAS